MSVAGWVATLLAGYLLWRLVKCAHFYFREYYVLWNVAVGGRSDVRSRTGATRLHVYVSKTELMDEVSVNELYNFLVRMIDTDVTIKEFHSVVLSYNYAALCRERRDGSLRGVFLMGLEHNELNGVKYTLFHLGLGFFQNYYRGGPLMYYVVAYHMLKELIYHPLTPLYIIGKAFSYKSYMALCHTFPHLYPRYDRETTEFARSIINEYGRKVKSPNEEYDADTFVLKRERTVIKEGVAPISQDDLKNPHINFFVKQNPDWVKGHQLIVAGEVTWRHIFRALWRRTRRSRREKGVDRRRNRFFSFQSETAKRYTTVYSKLDLGGGQKDHVVVSGEETIPKEGEEESDGGDGSSRPPRINRTFSKLHSYDVYDDIY